MKNFLRKIKNWIIAIILGGTALASLQINLLDTSLINYPLTANTNLEKLEFLYQSQEILRLQHNEMGRQYREGLITMEEWERYKKENFNPKSQAIAEGTTNIGDLLKKVIIGTVISTTTGKIIPNEVNARQFYKEQFKKSTRWKVDLNNIIKK